MFSGSNLSKYVHTLKLGTSKTSINLLTFLFTFAAWFLVVITQSNMIILIWGTKAHTANSYDAPQTFTFNVTKMARGAFASLKVIQMIQKYEIFLIDTALCRRYAWKAYTNNFRWMHRAKEENSGSRIIFANWQQSGSIEVLVLFLSCTSCWDHATRWVQSGNLSFVSARSSKPCTFQYLSSTQPSTREIKHSLSHHNAAGQQLPTT